MDYTKAEYRPVLKYLSDGRSVPSDFGFPQDNDSSHNKSMKLGGDAKKKMAAIAVAGRKRTK